MGVVNLAERRARSHQQPDDAARCRCGSEWFRLERRSPDSGVSTAGAVTMTAAGRVNGWAGWPVCEQCGTPWA